MGATPDAQRRMLDAAVEALLDLGVADLVTAVGTRTLARRAGVAPSTFFHHFGSTEAFATALLALVFDPERPGLAPAETDRGLRRMGEEELPSRAAIDWHRTRLANLVDDREQPLRLGLAMLGGPAAREAYARYLRSRDEPVITGGQGLYEAWNRDLRPPLTWTSYIALHTAMLSGAAVRERCDPGTIDVDTYARSAAAFSATSIRVQGSRRDLDQRIAESNYFPVASRRRQRVRPGRDGRRQQVLDAARVLFADHGFDAVTISQVARAADVSPSGVYGVVGGKAELAVALVHDLGSTHLRHRRPADADPDADLDADADADADAGAGDVDDLAARLVPVAHLLERCRPLLVPYGQSLADADGLDADPLLAAVRRAVAAAVTAGDLAGVPPDEIDDLGQVALMVLVQRVAARPPTVAGEAGAEPARFVARLLRHGLAAAPAPARSQGGAGPPLP